MAPLAQADPAEAAMPASARTRSHWIVDALSA